MTRTRLSRDEIRSLINQYRDVFRYYQQMDYSIPKPRLTPTLSESLIAYLLEENRVILGNHKITDVTFSKTGGDLTFASKDNQTIRVEVKSTAECAFQYFGEKDCEADYLIWIHFGRALQNVDISDLEIVVIAGPDLRSKKDQLPKSLKVTLDRIKKVFPQVPKYHISLDTL